MEALSEILNCEIQLLTAIQKNDLQQLDLLLHQDLLFVNQIGKTITKEMDMQNYKSGEVKIESVEGNNHIVSFIGKTAVVSVTVRIKGIYMNHQLNNEYQYLRIWAKENHIWQVIAGSCIEI